MFLFEYEWLSWKVNITVRLDDNTAFIINILYNKDIRVLFPSLCTSMMYVVFDHTEMETELFVTDIFIVQYVNDEGSRAKC